MKSLSLDEIWKMLEEGSDDPDFVERNKAIIQKWIDRGDGVAVYENSDLGSPMIGHKQYTSYGSKAAQLETETPPERLPDMGGNINWRYILKGVYRA